MGRRLFPIFVLLLILAAYGGANAAVLNSNTDYSGGGNWVGTAGPDTMTNNNGVTINGSILAQDGNDQIIMETGPGSVTGVIDGGAGTDEIIYGGGTWTYGHASVVNIENFSVNATADLTLNGVWDLANGTAQVSGGSLTINQSLNAGGLIINSGSATINGSTVISGAVNNSGNLDVNGSLIAGSLINSSNLGVNGSLSVGSLINSGALGVGGTLIADSLINSGALGVGGSLIAGSLINSGNLGVGGSLRADSLINSGALGVGGSLIAGSLINSGSLPVGGTLIADSLINSGFLPVGGTLIAGSLDNSGTLEVGGSLSAGSLTNSGSAYLTGRAAISGALVNSGYLNVSGSLSACNLTNSGYAAISGTADIREVAYNSGSLIVNGTLTSASLTNSGYIEGTGTINANIINTGIMSPGNSIGTLTVEGSVVFDTGSILVAELDCTGLSDLLKVSGPVAINGGSISTAIPRELYVKGFSWRVIASSQSEVSGLFDAIDNQTKSAVLTLSQANTGDAFSLVIDRKSFGAFADGGAADAGRGLDALVPLAQGDMENLLVTMDFDLEADQIAKVVNALNPEMYTAFSAASLNSGRLFDKTMALRLEEQGQRRAYSLVAGRDENGLAQLAAAEATSSGMVAGQAPRGWGMWGRALGLWTNQDQADGYLGRGQKTGGAAIGADYMVKDWLVLGLAAGVTRTDLSWSGGSYDGDIDAVHTGLYAQAGFHGFFTRGTASYARLSSSGTRPVNFETFDADAKSDFDANLFDAGLSLGYQARLGSWLLEPMAGLDYQHLSEDGFSESGADFLSLGIADRDTDSALFNLGLSATRLMRAGGLEIVPRLGISWQHQFGDDRPSLEAAFTGYGSAPFNVSGAEFPADLAVAEAGISATMRPGLDFFADYIFAFADDYQAQALSAGLKIGW